MAKLNQEQLLAIFNALKKEMVPFEHGFVKARIDIEGRYELWSEKSGIIVIGKPKAEISFTGLILQSSYVGFYYMPIYTNTEEIRSKLSAGLLKTLKGKSCFHITKVDDQLLKDIKHAMQVGYDEYKKNGWL